MVVRRLVLVVLAVLAPMAAACSVSPTGVDEAPPPPASTDTTKRGEGWPWN